ncbi:uncharacterized protein [Musca autumnalis]|uniref:uncharacterized protein n=1 Tax=Musca autumnalis TaxID=221902 RepID=UPI003CEDB495
MRPTLFKKENYVSYNKDTNKSTCLLCHRELCGLIIGNIKRHYETMHNIKFTRDYLPTAKVHINTLTRSKDDQILRLSKNRFVKCCVGLITVKNLPLKIFDDEQYFRKIIEPYQEEYSLQLNSKNILDGLDFWALRVKSHMQGKFHKKLLSLKVDVVGSGSQAKSVMGIHIQYVENYKLVSHSIGAVQLKKRQYRNHRFMKEAILISLKEYGIDMRQLYALTCDGRGKTLKALQLIQQDLEELCNENINDMEDSSDVDMAFKPFVSVVYSGCYIIELAARLFFTTIECDLNECRSVIQEIRQQDINHIFLPSLDNNGRWQSTFDMMASLKDFIENGEIDTDYRGKMDWLESFMDTHKPLTEWLQHQHEAQYIVGDFYRDWLVCEAKLKQMSDNEYAMHLLEAVLEVKQSLLDNEAFNAALYFDPRFNHLDSPYFSEERRKQAVDHIMRIQSLMKTMELDTRLESDDYDAQNNAKLIGRCEDPYNILEAEIPQIARNSTAAEIRVDIRQKLEAIALGPRLPYSANILEYWQQMQIKDPEIHVLMKVVLSVCISQTSVERTRSALATILTKEKSRLPKSVLNNMLLVKLNADFLEEVEA